MLSAAVPGVSLALTLPGPTERSHNEGTHGVTRSEMPTEAELARLVIEMAEDPNSDHWAFCRLCHNKQPRHEPDCIIPVLRERYPTEGTQHDVA